MEFNSKEIFIRGQHVAQVVLSVYGGAVSYEAVTRLRKYETTAQKLAEWSSQAAHELHKTRTTQTSGAVAILASLVASLTLTIVPGFLSKWVRIGISPALLVAVLLARGHIANYWAPKDGKTVGVRVPLPNMGDYNEAQKKTEKLLEVLEYLEYSWVAASVVNAMLVG